MSVGLDTTLNRNDELLHASVGAEECVMMSIEAGSYYGLNAVGSRIWELLESPKTVGQLCRQICEEFEVDAQTCEAAVVTFVDDLIKNRIVHAAES
jgi:hypothetical protein